MFRQSVERLQPDAGHLVPVIGNLAQSSPSAALAALPAIMDLASWIAARLADCNSVVARSSRSKISVLGFMVGFA